MQRILEKRVWMFKDLVAKGMVFSLLLVSYCYNKAVKQTAPKLNGK